MLDPDLLVADEPVSALDVSIQADILALIDDLRAEFGLSVLFISHDISVVREVCDRIAVMYLGEIVEIGPTERVLGAPKHPYTEALVSAVPTPDPRASDDPIELTGSVPSPSDPPSGCRFHTRCHRVIQPDHLDLDQSVWRRLLDFRERVVAGEIDSESVRERVRVGEAGPGASAARSEQAAADDTGAAPDTDAARVRAAYDLPATFRDPDIDRAVADAVAALLSGDDARAAETLAEAVTTPCAEQAPEFTTHGGGHRAACLRHRPYFTSGAFDAE